jgi:hypothetical protein
VSWTIGFRVKNWKTCKGGSAVGTDMAIVENFDSPFISAGPMPEPLDVIASCSMAFGSFSAIGFAIGLRFWTGMSATGGV